MKAIKTEFAAEWRDNGKLVRGCRYPTVKYAGLHARTLAITKYRIIKIETFERESVLVAKK